MNKFCWLCVAGLTACSSAPPPPDWQMNAYDAMQRASEAYLSGNARVEALEYGRAKSEVARTGRADLLARVELARCAGRVASLVQEDCTGFEKLRADAAAPERAYADYLAGRADAASVAQLPPQHRAAAGANDDATALQALQSITDPQARLVAAGVVFRRGQASPAALALAVETASGQGWRRPLLAWLGVQLMRAEKVGDSAEVERLRRRIQLIEGGGA